MLALTGCIVTIDAIGCQREVAEKITEKGGDYVLALKGNQGRLYQEVRGYFEEAEQRGFSRITCDFHKTTDAGHGRVEVRRYWIADDTQWLPGAETWPGLQPWAWSKPSATPAKRRPPSDATT